MKEMSVSFTLGKASDSHGGNPKHNEREFVSSNVDINRCRDNIYYVQQDIRDAYDELFADSLAEYNAKQKQPCRRIDDYYEHISSGRREEKFYEAVVQLSDSVLAPVGSPLGEAAAKMLDEYMREFQKRNKNLHVFSASLHLDEAAPHLHIDFVPFYTQGRKNGLSKGVSMKAALIEQGFSPRGAKANHLVMWEDGERKILESVLQRHGFNREIMNVTHEHMDVPQYKESVAAKKLKALSRRRTSPRELTAQNIMTLQQEVALLKNENEKMTTERNSVWKSFYYSDSSKQEFVQGKLDENNIPYRETEHGFEAKEIYVLKIREFEKQFKSPTTSARDELRAKIDKYCMQSKNIAEVMARLKNDGYELQYGKYLGAKPRYHSNYIRFKSLGEHYSETALRNRITFKQRYENDIESKIKSAEKNPDSLELMTYKTMKHYTIVFAMGVLPIRKKNQNKPFMWENDAELDKLAELNKRINSGATLDSLRNEFKSLEDSVSNNERKLNKVKSDLKYFNRLHDESVKFFEGGSGYVSDMKEITEGRVTAQNYHRIKDVLILDEEADIVKLKAVLTDERAKLKEASQLLTTFERVAGGTYIQEMVDEEKERRQGEFLNGVKSPEDNTIGGVKR